MFVLLTEILFEFGRQGQERRFRFGPYVFCFWIALVGFAFDSEFGLLRPTGYGLGSFLVLGESLSYAIEVWFLEGGIDGFFIVEFEISRVELWAERGGYFRGVVSVFFLIEIGLVLPLFFGFGVLCGLARRVVEAGLVAATLL